MAFSLQPVNITDNDGSMCILVRSPLSCRRVAKSFVTWRYLFSERFARPGFTWCRSLPLRRCDSAGRTTSEVGSCMVAPSEIDPSRSVDVG